MPDVVTAQSDGDDEAFQRLYPDQHYDRFLDNGLRPDGRIAGLARETTIGLGTVTSADSSALVKIGKTMVMAGVKLEVMKPSDDNPEDGALLVEVELTPMSSALCRPGRSSERAQVLAAQLEAHLTSARTVLPHELCIHKASAAWVLRCDVYVLNDDGALLDACLLAAVASLASLRLPPVAISKEGQVMVPGTEVSEGGSVVDARPLPMGAVPLALTCGLRRGHLIADPTSAEEGLMEALITAILDHEGRIIGVHKPGGIPVADSVLQDCIETSRLRYSVLASLLAQELEQAAQQGRSDEA